MDLELEMTPAHQSAPRGKWGPRGYPLYISIVANTVLFLVIFWPREKKRVDYTYRATLTPITERVRPKTLEKKKKQIAQKTQKIQKQALKKKIAKAKAKQAKQARQARQAKTPAAKSRSSNPWERDYDNPVRRESRSARSENIREWEDPAASHRSASWKKKYNNSPNSGKPTGSQDLGTDPNLKGVGPKDKKPGPGKVSRGPKSWGGPGAGGSYLVRNPNPTYPTKLRARAIQGKVVARVYFGPDGSVYQVEIRSASHMDLAREVKNALYRWKANATLKSGQRYLTRTFRFTL